MQYLPDCKAVFNFIKLSNNLFPRFHIEKPIVFLTEIFLTVLLIYYDVIDL